MIDVKSTFVITVKTPKVISVITEPKYKKIATLKSPEGLTYSLKPHQMKKSFMKFLESAGFTIEYEDSIVGAKGTTLISGVPVKVLPIQHTNYDGGAYIKINEKDATDESNTRTVLKYLRKNKIDIERYCELNRDGKSCIRLLQEKTT